MTMALEAVKHLRRRPHCVCTLLTHERLLLWLSKADSLQMTLTTYMGAGKVSQQQGGAVWAQSPAAHLWQTWEYR